MHGTGHPSDWVRRWASLLPAQATVLDLACGTGDGYTDGLLAHGNSPKGLS